MARQKTRGEVIAERLEQEAEEMIQQVQDDQKESEPEAENQIQVKQTRKKQLWKNQKLLETCSKSLPPPNFSGQEPDRQ